MVARITKSRRHVAEGARVAGFTALLAATGALGQDRDDEVLAGTSDGRQLLVLPQAQTTRRLDVVIDGVEIDIGVEDGFRVYRATHRDRVHTARAAADGPPRWFAFDPQRERFAELTPTLRIEMTDFDRIDEVATAAGAVGAIRHPALGWALLRLKPESNPAAVAEELAKHELVTRADIVLRGPPVIPM